MLCVLNRDYVFCKSDCSGDNDDDVENGDEDVENGDDDVENVDNDGENVDDDGDQADAVDFESYTPLEQPLDLRWSPDEK